MTYKLKPATLRHSVPPAPGWSSVVGVVIMSFIMALTLYLIWNKSSL